MARDRIRWLLVVDRAREIVDGYAPLKVTLRRPDRHRPRSTRPACLAGRDRVRRRDAPWFRLDRSAGQKQALYVAAEKDTLRQQLTGWLEFAGIPVLVVRGFSSQSYADVVRDRVAHEQREACPLVVGDHDPSGEWMLTALAEDVTAFAEAAGAEVQFVSIAVTPEQIETYRLPTALPKPTDRRSFSGTTTTQAESLLPDVLAAIVREEIEARRDMALLRRVIEREPAERQAIIDRLTGLR
ncbi:MULTISPECIES: hypothetical protein [unclassified Streptomyces]|uniref:hypothetical protein n=1 Tax=unclassified Streptomyces TaxID=2593676 RepID=UPI00343165D5